MQNTPSVLLISETFKEILYLNNFLEIVLGHSTLNFLKLSDDNRSAKAGATAHALLIPESAIHLT
jgi:hypothetical protein